MLATLIQPGTSLTLATDQYELTMALAYWKNGMAEREAVFHMFFRSNPFGGGYVVNAGLDTLIDFLLKFHFDKSDLDYLASMKDGQENPIFEDKFLLYLEKLRFNCDIHAIPEGTLVFPNEPLVRVQGPILQAQILESILLNTLNFQSLVATKASRISLAAQGDRVVDFGFRRAQGIDGGLSASRACYIGGCYGTSNVLAGKLLGIPVVGTHAHSWVMAFDNELESFEAYARAMPDNCLFLVDTFGTVTGLHNAIKVGLELKDKGHKMIGVRLDSGDLAYFSKIARSMLDEAGLKETLVMGSNELDEYVIRSLKTQGARINGWGVGTKMITASDDPALSGVYKLAAIRHKDDKSWDYKLKLSEQKFKISIPGVLQIHRFYNREGLMEFDAILEIGENPADTKRIIDPNDNTHQKKVRNRSGSEPLLRPIFERGKLVYQRPTLEKIRERVQDQLKMLDDGHKRFEFPHIYPVGLSTSLNKTRDEMIHRERELMNSME